MTLLLYDTYKTWLTEIVLGHEVHHLCQIRLFPSKVGDMGVFWIWALTTRTQDGRHTHGILQVSGALLVQILTH